MVEVLKLLTVPLVLPPITPASLHPLLFFLLFGNSGALQLYLNFWSRFFFEQSKAQHLNTCSVGTLNWPGRFSSVLRGKAVEFNYRCRLMCSFTARVVLYSDCFQKIGQLTVKVLVFYIGLIELLGKGWVTSHVQRHFENLDSPLVRVHFHSLFRSSIHMFRGSYDGSRSFSMFNRCNILVAL